MTYYDDRVNRYYSEGKTLLMTEEEAEKWQELHPSRNLTSDTDLPSPLGDDPADDYLDCKCPDDPPNANSTAPLCTACQAYFRSLENEI
jgi:hypothetical protein